MRYATVHGLELASDAETNRAIGLIEAALSDVIEPYPFLTVRSFRTRMALPYRACAKRRARRQLQRSRYPFFSLRFPRLLGNDRNSVLRVAENLIHETLHLQLTLFEGLSPLVNTASTWSMHSPWKQERRPVQGLLHGLYVFSVLRWMWRQVSETTQNRTERDFALRRIAEIDEEVSSIRALEESPALTEEGRHFLHQLFVA